MSCPPDPQRGASADLSVTSITYSQDMRSVAAIFEWIIAFVFDIYLATFVLDLWPAAKT